LARDKELNRTSFYVEEEGTRPCLVLEVVSPRYPGDDTTKVQIYQQAGVAEYFIFNPQAEADEPTLQGYHLVGGVYRPITADSKGRLLSRTTGLWFEVSGSGQELLFTDVATGELLLSEDEVRAALVEAKIRAEEAEFFADEAKARAAAAELSANEAEARADEAEARAAEAEARAAEEAARAQEAEARAQEAEARAAEEAARVKEVEARAAEEAARAQEAEARAAEEAARAQEAEARAAEEAARVKEVEARAEEAERQAQAMAAQLAQLREALARGQ
jgi:hypothetical protein